MQKIFIAIRNFLRKFKPETRALICFGAGALYAVIICLFALWVYFYPEALAWIIIIPLLLWAWIEAHKKSPADKVRAENEKHQLVTETIYRTIKNHYKLFSLVPPTEVMELLPVDEPGIKKLKNGLSYYHFLVQLEDKDKVQFSDLRRLINFKLKQNFTRGYWECPGQLYVIRVETSQYQPQEYCAIDVMLIDSEEKQRFIESLERDLKAECRKKVPPTVQDREF